MYFNVLVSFFCLYAEWFTLIFNVTIEGAISKKPVIYKRSAFCGCRQTQSVCILNSLSPRDEGGAPVHTEGDK